MPEITIQYTAPPTIARFMECCAPVRALIGPFGSGKSSGCVMELFRRCVGQHPGTDMRRRTRWAIIRNTYPELRDTTRKTFENWIPRELGSWRKSDFEFHMSFRDVRADFLFRALDRPDHIQKLMSLELTGAWINEARETPRSVFEVLEGRVGRYPSVNQGGATWSGIILDTNPWAQNHWGYQLFSLGKILESSGRVATLSPEHRAKYALFEQPGGRSPGAENIENLQPGYYDRIAIGKDSEWIESYVDGRYPSASEGSFWGRQVADLEARGGLRDFEVVPTGVHTSWDLGIDDSTAIWFWRIGPDRTIEVIDFYSESGQPISHYVDLLRSKGYGYARHWLPHDARARTMMTGATIEEELGREFGRANVAITPGLSLLDGIQSGRWLLEYRGLKVHTRCMEGIEAIRAYHKEWDNVAKVFGSRPVHDWSSHAADAWRYMSVVVRVVEKIARPKPGDDPNAGSILRNKSGARPSIKLPEPTLDRLWNDKQRIEAMRRF